MKLIIAGSRTIKADITFLNGLFDQFMLPDLYACTIISGGAKGIDESGQMYAEYHGYKPILFPADWDKHGKAAGHIRNKQMADYADALLLIWDGESKGSANMKENMLKLNKPVYEVILRKHNT